VLTRNEHDWTERFLTIVAAAVEFKARSCLIDGEAVCRLSAHIVGLIGARKGVAVIALRS
jgi:ATP-dependent DNA ligase